jgi:hypothetical protein
MSGSGWDICIICDEFRASRGIPIIDTWLEGDNWSATPERTQIGQIARQDRVSAWHPNRIGQRTLRPEELGELLKTLFS